MSLTTENIGTLGNAAISGASGGALIGSFGGVTGAVVGAVVGSVVGSAAAAHSIHSHEQEADAKCSSENRRATEG